MKLLLRNFAKIKEAEIRFDGLTVIAGNNNTGKSTVGKVLFTRTQFLYFSYSCEALYFKASRSPYSSHSPHYTPF